MKVELMNITPAMAQEFLKTNTRNRSVSMHRVKQFALDMQKGDWAATHQGIAIYRDGSIADGQHRLMAIVQSNTTVQMLVTRNLDDEAGASIDITRPRSEVDAIRIGRLSDWITKNHVAIAKVLADTPLRGPFAVHTFISKHQEAIKFGWHCFGGSKVRYVTVAPVIAAVCLASYFEDKNRLAEFGLVMQTGVIDSQDDISAIQAFCKKERISKIYAPAQNIYILEEA